MEFGISEGNYVSNPFYFFVLCFMPAIKSNRENIINDLLLILSGISVSNGYNTDFFDVRIWDDIPTEYTQNEIILRDPRCSFEKKSRYEATVRIELVAIVIEEANNSASKMGNLALEDLIKAVLSLQTCKAMVCLNDAEKFIDTKGKTACEISLNVDVKFVI